MEFKVGQKWKRSTGTIVKIVYVKELIDQLGLQ